MSDTTARDLASLTPDQLRQLVETQARTNAELEQRIATMQVGWRIVSGLLEHGCGGCARVPESALRESSGEVTWHRVSGGYVLSTRVPTA